jgi:hypothetical protein
MRTRCPLIFATLFAAASAVHAAEPAPSAAGKPASNRWQIHSSVYGLTKEGQVVSRSENTILLDTETGKTWLLWPTKDVPYSWIELPQRKDAASIRIAE